MHPQHQLLHNELHARPSIHVAEPSCLFHYAFLIDADEHAELLLPLSEATGVACATEQAQQILTLAGGVVLKWERHTEFSTLTLMMPQEREGDSWPVPPAWLAQIIETVDTSLVNATLVRTVGCNEWQGSVEAYGLVGPAGSQVGGGDATVWSDFRLDANGFNRVLLLNENLNAERLGRMVRRLLEIETYRMMASLSLPLAKELARELEGYEIELSELSARNAEQESANPDPRQLLAALSQLSARLERSGSRSRQRFSATDAYARIVFSRIEELREARVSDFPRLGTFILRRFRPTVHYCAAIHQRQVSLAQSAARLNDLLRTRAQVEIEEQNLNILKSLNERASSQLKIQKAVEGLSIIVISYYLFSLFKLGLQSLDALGMEIQPQLAAAIVAPLGSVIVGVLAWRIWRVRR